MIVARPQDIVITPMGARFMGRMIPCTVGRGGVVDAALKREGDGGTPTGVHAIGPVLYRPDRIPCPVPGAMPIGPGDLWSDDAGDAAYNQHVRAPYAPSHEKLRRADPMYDLVVVTGWNWPVATAGRGSAIFIHQWRRPGAPTAGCIGFSRRDLRWIVANLAEDSRLIVLPRQPRQFFG